MRELSRNSSIWHMIAAPTVWALHFGFVYGWTASACEHWNASGAARWGIALATIFALVLIAVISWRAWRQWDFLDDRDHIHDQPTEEDRKEFLGHAGWLLAIVSTIGVIFVAMPALFIRNCL